MHVRRLLSIVALAVASCVLVGTAAQEPLANWPGFTQRKPMRVIVDGARNPELIPDSAAIGVFMSSIAIPPGADRKAYGSMHAKIASMRLSREDTRTVVVEAMALHSSLSVERRAVVSAYQEARRQRTAATVLSATNAEKARTAVVLASYARLLRRLSPAGADKLRAQIATMKRQMKTVALASR